MAATLPIYFRSLQLENVRCFGDSQTLELTDNKGYPAQWTLLLGDNGVGKTTLLQCLAWMRPIPALTVKESEGHPDTIEPALNHEENEVLNSLLRTGSQVQLGLQATLSTNQELGLPKRNIRMVETAVQMIGQNSQLQSRELIPARLPSGLQNLHTIEPPIFAYGAARRMGSANLDKSEFADPLASLFSDTTELYDAEEILLDLDYLAAKRRGSRHKRRLQQVKELLASILPDVPHAESIQILGPKVPGLPDEPSGVRFKTPYGEVPLSGLSLGYQTTLAWTTDLVFRLYERYPDSPNPLAEPAIVLVDEIDLHLHPHWQRRIIADLTQHFPKTQFIATSHSPLVAQSAANANLVVLQRQGDQVVIENRPQIVEDWRVDQILTSALFDIKSARSPRIERLIEERHALLDKLRRSPQEEDRLRELEEELDDLPTAERQEDQEAMDLIRQAAALLKEQESRE